VLSDGDQTSCSYGHFSVAYISLQWENGFQGECPMSGNTYGLLLSSPRNHTLSHLSCIFSQSSHEESREVHKLRFDEQCKVLP
jgi:hypothetical protein